MVLATPVLAMTLALIGLERLAHVGIFDPALGRRSAAVPAPVLVLFPSRRLHHDLAGNGRGERDHSLLRAAPGIRLSLHGLFDSRHHGDRLHGVGPSHVRIRTVDVSSIVFSILSFIVAVPSAIKVFNWTATLHKGDITFEAPMLYALGFIGLFMLGGLTGLILAAPALDVPLTDTYFVVAHFHYVMVGGSVMAYLGGIHYWWPKITGKMYSEAWARAAAILMFFGFNLTFFPQYILGYEGMPRRYHSYLADFQILNVLSSAGASLLALAYLMPVAYLLASLRSGRAAGTILECQRP